MSRITGRRLAVIPALLTVACGPSDPDPSGAGNAANLVEVVARGLTFEAPEEIPSGWTTFRLRNESAMTHFAVLERMPEGFGIEQQQHQVAPVFQAAMDLLNAGNTEAARDKLGELPEWFGQIVFMGGPGLISPERTAEATVFLDPGTYLLECYVKTNGVFHSFSPDSSSFGMVHEIDVTRESSGAPEPLAELQITVSSERGIEVAGDPVVGEQTVAVYFADQKMYENFVGHDVHLARLSDDTDLEELARWMDWRLSEGLETPAPVEFLGGTHEMPTGGKAYFTAKLEPGRYAWVSEVTNPAQKGLLKTFTVPPEDDRRLQ